MLETLPIYQTKTIAEAAKDTDTMEYLGRCITHFLNGDYGEVPPEDTKYNNADIEAGEGHALARYKQYGALTGDIYIEAHFSKSVEGTDANNILIMYPGER